MNTISKLVIVPLLAGCIAHADTRIAAAAPDEPNRPVVTSPVDGQKVSGFEMEAAGRSLKGRYPFFAVGPVKVSPQTWIQPRIHSQYDDGSVIGWINFGTAEKGAGENFLVYLLACEKANPFGDTKVVHSFPAGCIVSAPVKVTRVK